MVSQLARLLRKTLQAGDQKTVPLEEDLSMAETYLKLEKVRFEDRLDWELSVTEASLEHQVPFMLVQTLVENAVRHGIGQRRTGGTISIEAALTGNAGKEDSSLCLRVSNPGELDEKSGAEQDSGAGLENARERLQLLFGDEATLELTQKPGTVTATARIPQPSALEDQLVGSDFGPETVRRTDEAGLIEAGGSRHT
jgi:LytS/YehU family sensor histidine kinase